MPQAVLLIDPRDDVAVALTNLAVGDRVAENVVAATEIPAGHKVALHAVAKGEPVRKYGWPIGHATADIAAGDHVHSHNLATSLSGVEDYAYAPAAPEPLPRPEPATFQGYRRKNGRVGTRNVILEQARMSSGPYAGRLDHVLQAERDAVQRTTIAAG